MIELKQNENPNKAYWYCTKCNFAFFSLQEATEHELICKENSK
jgi:hypothetical protein